MGDHPATFSGFQTSKSSPGEAHLSEAEFLMVYHRSALQCVGILYVLVLMVQLIAIKKLRNCGTNAQAIAWQL